MATVKRLEDDAKNLKELFEPHIQSFNFLLGEGIQLAVKDLLPVEV
tara:strand:- start:152 stop:289 length:138 start_codon:yes stop_codon:yes gene_type:complete